MFNYNVGFAKTYFQLLLLQGHLSVNVLDFDSGIFGATIVHQSRAWATNGRGQRISVVLCSSSPTSIKSRSDDVVMASSNSIDMFVVHGLAETLSHIVVLF